MSCNFMSCIFMSFIFSPSFSCPAPAISWPAHWSVNFVSCNFMPCKMVRQFHVRHFHVQHFQRPPAIVNETPLSAFPSRSENSKCRARIYYLRLTMTETYSRRIDACIQRYLHFKDPLLSDSLSYPLALISIVPLYLSETSVLYKSLKDGKVGSHYRSDQLDQARSSDRKPVWQGSEWSASIGCPTRLFLTVKKSSSDRVAMRSRSDRVLVE